MEILPIYSAQIQLVRWTIEDLLAEGEWVGLPVHLDDLLNIFLRKFRPKLLAFDTFKNGLGFPSSSLCFEEQLKTFS